MKFLCRNIEKELAKVTEEPNVEQQLNCYGYGRIFIYNKFMHEMSCKAALLFSCNDSDETNCLDYDVRRFFYALIINLKAVYLKR